MLEDLFILNRAICLAVAACLTTGAAYADNYFLTLGGGYSPEGNQVSLERNVLYFQSILQEQGLAHQPHDLFFADGNDDVKDVQVIDRNTVPKANRLMAEFLGTQRDLGLHYRNHNLENVHAELTPDAVRTWFRETGSKLKDGDRLLIYVTSHGSESDDAKNEYDTTIAMWNDSDLKVSEFVQLLDRLNPGVEVIAVMVQCHSGGFARMIFNGGNPDRGFTNRRRCGFFATVHDREAAGCTAEIDDANTYVEYSTYFWNAISGHDRSGKPIELPDYDGNGTVSFEEAHAYTVLTADTIDLPIKTSGEFLSVYSVFGTDDPDLLGNEEPYSVVLKFASPSERAVLEGLSKQLKLSGENRLVDAYKETEKETAPPRGRRTQSPAGQLRRKIAGDLRRQWPELANVFNPLVLELLTTRSQEFIDAVEKHRDYARYRELADQEQNRPDPEKSIVKYERFLRFADNVILAENLKRMGDAERIAQFESILALERESLRD